MRLLTRATFVVGILAITCLLSVSRATGGCDQPVLLQKSAEGTLSEKQAKRVRLEMKRWLERSQRFAEEERDYLAYAEQADPESPELWQRKVDFFYDSVSHIQFALEAYASLNDGFYPYSLGTLVCSHMMDDLPLNAFTGQALEEVGLTMLSSGELSGLAYVPEYIRLDGKPVVVGYWLLAVSPEVRRREAMDTAGPARPLPGNWPQPPDTVLVLESHPAK